MRFRIYSLAKEKRGFDKKGQNHEIPIRQFENFVCGVSNRPDIFDNREGRRRGTVSFRFRCIDRGTNEVLQGTKSDREPPVQVRVQTCRGAHVARSLGKPKIS